MSLSCTFFGDRVRYWSKIANFNLPHLHLVPTLRVIAFEFYQKI